MKKQWLYAEVIELPEDAVWEVVHKTAQMLNDRCDDLAELCGYERKED